MNENGNGRQHVSSGPFAADRTQEEAVGRPLRARHQHERHRLRPRTPPGLVVPGLPNEGLGPSASHRPGRLRRLGPLPQMRRRQRLPPTSWRRPHARRRPRPTHHPRRRRVHLLSLQRPDLLGSRHRRGALVELTRPSFPGRIVERLRISSRHERIGWRR